MSKYDENSRKPAPKKQTSSLEIWDVLSVAMLLLTLCLVLYFAAIFISPTASYNPLKPKPRIDPLAPPTPTITPIQLEPTWTPTATPETTATATLLPTLTMIPSPTPFSMLPPTKTAEPTQAPKIPYSATIKAIDSTIIHPELGCKWQAIGGTVVDANNADMIGMTIRLVGFYGGKAKNELTVSSIAPAYGKSGFEFPLGTTPLSSKGELYLQLLDQAGATLSDNVYIDLYDDCERNLILVRFVKNP
jgi:hypothetical protein